MHDRWESCCLSGSSWSPSSGNTRLHIAPNCIAANPQCRIGIWHLFKQFEAKSIKQGVRFSILFWTSLQLTTQAVEFAAAHFDRVQTCMKGTCRSHQPLAQQGSLSLDICACVPVGMMPKVGLVLFSFASSSTVTIHFGNTLRYNCTSSISTPLPT